MTDSSDFISESSDAIMSSEDEAQSETPAVEPPPAETDTSPDPESQRFIRELEFLQCLANPRYLYFLSQQNYFGDPSFVNYLRYLLYWTRPEYIKYVRYPQAIEFIRLLQDPDFRRDLADFRTILQIEDTQARFDAFYRKNRMDQTLPVVEAKTPST